jgi:hypothetical protein
MIALLIASIVCAMPAAASMLIPASDIAQQQAQAPAHSWVIGEGFDLQRVDFIHYAKPEKPPGTTKPSKTEPGYVLLGYSWKNLPVKYVINPNTFDGMNPDDLVGAITTSAETWDRETATELFANVAQTSASAVYGVQNFENAIDFGPYQDTNVIAVTTIWYSPRLKQIVEFDIRFNEYYVWGDASVANDLVMDLQNIATHEFGHAIGLGDVYSTTYDDVTMYGYADTGDINKRTLEIPDIKGLQKLYGA